MTKSLNLIIIDDHPLIRAGIRQLLSIYPDMNIVAEGSNGEEAIELVNTNPCDILLLDINMPVLNGIEATKKIRITHPNLKIIMFTVENDFYTLQEAISLDVNGYLLKESAGDTLIDAINHVHSEGHFIDQLLTKHIFSIMKTDKTTITNTTPSSTPFSHLTSREKDILYYISRGLTNKQIAAKLYLSEKTIRNTITSLFKKINVKDRVQATIYALNHHLDIEPKEGK
ncbi:MAG: response regulator [Cellulosilyticaceae bacterium]